MASADAFLDGKQSADEFLGPEKPRDPLAEKVAAIEADRAAAEAAEPGAGEYLLDRAKKGFAGFMGAPGDMADAYRDIPVMPHPALVPFAVIFNKLTGSRLGLSPITREKLPTESVIATSKTYRDAFGYEGLQTENPALRYAGGVAEMGAAGGPMTLARGVNVLPMAMSTTGAGIGLEAGGDVFEGLGLDRQAGEAVGAVSGGILPMMTGAALSGAGSYVRSRFSPSAQRAAAEAAVSKEVTPLLEQPQAQANLVRSLEVTDDFARAGVDFAPPLPARTGSPGLVAIHKDLVTRNPQALNRAVENVQKNEAAVAEFVNKTLPAGKQTSVQRVAGLMKQAAQKLEAMRVAVDDKLDDLAARFQRSPSNFELGKRVRDLVIKQKEVYRGISGQKYQEVYQAADKLGVKADITDVMQYADDVLKNDLRAYQQSEIPPVFRQLSQQGDLPEGAAAFIQQQGGQAPGQVSFAKLHSLLKRTNGDIASLRGSSAVDRDFKLHLLGELKTRLETKIARFEDAGFGEVSTKLREANRFYRDEYLPRFKQGFGDDVLARYSSGEFKIPNAEVVRQITSGNNVQAAKDFRALFDDVPEAWQALRDGYMDALYTDKGLIAANGKVNPKILDGFLRRNAETLKEFPQIRNELQQLKLDNDALLARRAKLVAAEKKLAAADLYKLFNGKNPAEVIPEAVKNPNAMRVLVHKARHTPREAQTLARAIADDIIQQPDPLKYYSQNRETIRIGLKALGSDHLKNVETALEALSINRRADIPSFVQQSGIAPDPFAAATGSSARAMVSHYVNVARGRTGVNQEAAAFLSRWFDKLRADHKAVAMERVFYDKNAARAIAEYAKHPESPKFKADFTSAMISIGIRAEIAAQE